MPCSPAQEGRADTTTMRTGVERGMVTTLAVVALLLVLLAAPGFSSDHVSVGRPQGVLALCSAVVLVAAIPSALVGRQRPARGWLWTSVAAYVALLGLEPFVLRPALPTGSTPWLLSLSLVAFGSVAIAASSPVRAGAVCAALDAALAAVYAGEIPVSHSVIDAVGLGLLAAGLIAGVRVLRARADRADRSEVAARLLYEDQRRQAAVEAERIQTDALLHDSLLAALLAAAGHEAPARATSMAQSALDIISDADQHPVMQPSVVSLGAVLAAAEQDFGPLRGHADIDLTAVTDTDLPLETANALVSATLQAVTNSISHGGSSARRSVVGVLLEHGGIRIDIEDDGAGFELDAVGHERLGVRVSILERVRAAGASAAVRSAPGRGTSVVLEWHPTVAEQPTARRAAIARIPLIPRRHLYRVLAAVISVAILTAVSETVLFSRAVGPVIAAVIGLVILPALLRGARTGVMRPRVAWAIAAGGVLLCCTATIGLDPTAVDCVSIYWYTCGVLAGAVMVWMNGHHAPPIVAVALQVTQITLWAGPTGAIRLGLAAEIVLVIAGLMLHRAVRLISAAADVSAARQRVLISRRADLDAFHLERRDRLQRANSTAAPMLRHIVHQQGLLDPGHRAECRILEQALRDEIRGRSLLNAATRKAVSGLRRRGAFVQVLDDGGLDGMASDTLNTLLDDAAHRLEAVDSTRVVIRTGQPDSDTAITIVASTPDETAAALGVDADDEVDLWTTISRPVAVGIAA
jgi:signal transduction histidine kinase